MTIIEYFDPYNIQHIKAYRHLMKTGFWPKEFFPEHVEWPMIWQASLAGKMALAWLELAESGKIEGMKQ